MSASALRGVRSRRVAAPGKRRAHALAGQHRDLAHDRLSTGHRPDGVPAERPVAVDQDAVRPGRRDGSHALVVCVDAAVRHRRPSMSAGHQQRPHPFGPGGERRRTGHQLGGDAGDDRRGDAGAVADHPVGRPDADRWRRDVGLVVVAVHVPGRIGPVAVARPVRAGGVPEPVVGRGRRPAIVHAADGHHVVARAGRHDIPVAEGGEVAGRGDDQAAVLPRDRVEVATRLLRTGCRVLPDAGVDDVGVAP